MKLEIEQQFTFKRDHLEDFHITAKKKTHMKSYYNFKIIAPVMLEIGKIEKNKTKKYFSPNPRER